MAILSLRLSGRDAKAPSPRTLREIEAGMRRDGVVVLENLFAMSLLRRLRRDVTRRHDSGQLRARGLVRDIGGRYTAVLPFEGPLLDRRFYANPALLGTLDALLGRDYCIGSVEAVVSLPGSSRQYQHIDGPLRLDRVVGRAKGGYPGDLSDLPPYALALATPLCDVNEENGPTAVWPGSHRVALEARLPGEAEIGRRFPVARMTGRFGFSYLYDYRLFHRGLPNFSREPRPLLMSVFTRAWYRDPNHSEVSPSVVITRRNLARIPERHRRLFMLAPASRRRLWGS